MVPVKSIHRLCDQGDPPVADVSEDVMQCGIQNQERWYPTSRNYGFLAQEYSVNEAELEAEDTEGLIGTGAGDLTLEGLTADLSVAVNFSDDTDGAGGATAGDSGEGTGDENGGGNAAGTDENGTDPELGNETGGIADEGSSGSEESGTDAGDTGSESPADSADQPGSGVGADDTRNHAG